MKDKRKYAGRNTAVKSARKLRSPLSESISYPIRSESRNGSALAGYFIALRLARPFRGEFLEVSSLPLELLCTVEHNARYV